MTTQSLIAGALLAVFSFSTKAQNVSSTNTLTSGGFQAGTSGVSGVYYGHMAGLYNTTGERNTFIGHQNGKNNTTGHRNTFLGAGAGFFNTTGYENTTIGAYAGEQQNGIRNTYLGAFSGSSTSLLNGSRNTYIGYRSGFDNPGSGNVFLGYYTGYRTNVSNQLYIDNSSTSLPLVWGDFSANQLKFNGKVGIGIGSGAFPTTAGSVDVSDYNLIVKKGILTEEIRVMLQASWADYVFEENYGLLSLNEVERYIAENGHLPNTPSAKEVKENGIELGEIAKIQQEKIEELTLYIIEQNKKLENQQEKIEELTLYTTEQNIKQENQEKEIKTLKTLVNKLLEKIGSN